MGYVFSWALTLRYLSDLQGGTLVHLWFRGAIQARGVKRWAIVHGGELTDWLSTKPMFVGLRKRAEEQSMEGRRRR